MYDVIYIGGGPGGSTGSTLLKKYAPDLKVLVLERERFPREHVGESQLPIIGPVLHEMGVWDKVEAANFPIKVGATYRWGNTDDLWDFQFLPLKDFKDEERPGKFEGFRTRTAFQVERAVYDKILLDHAESMGVEVRQETKVTEVLREGDKVMGLKLDNGEVVSAKYYVDASGSSGILRRAMGVDIVEPSNLRNIAFWDYWDNAEWAVSVGKGGTRVLVMSLGYGWLWFIPLSPTRTSIGLVCPADYYRETGLSKEEVYLKAVHSEPKISELIKNAKADGEVKGTKDWSFYSERMYGENWFLVGEAAGFADPILAAGLTMTHIGSQELASTILALEEGKIDAEWLKTQYAENSTRRVSQHIKFADFWYTANGQFTDVKEHTRTIAAEVGLDLNAEKAFQWLGTGGFIEEHLFSGLSGYDLQSVIDTIELMTEGEAKMEILKYNRLILQTEDATTETFAAYYQGKVNQIERFRKGAATLPKMGFFWFLIKVLERGTDLAFVLAYGKKAAREMQAFESDAHVTAFVLSHLESLLKSGWIRGVQVPGAPLLHFNRPKMGSYIRDNVDLS